MNIIIGDIGNTVTKICLVKIKTNKVLKITYLNSDKIRSYSYLKKNLKTVITNKKISKFSLFSSVVPKHQKNLTGTSEAYRPAGHVFSQNHDSKKLRDYVPWSPE